MMNNKNWILINKPFINAKTEQILTICAYGEARSESDDGIQGVISCVRNRVSTGGWFIDPSITAISTSTHGVILKKWQFSCFLPEDPNQKILKELITRWDTNILVNKILIRIFDIVNKNLPDNIEGATYYHAKGIMPKWVSSMRYIKQIGRHLFYKPKEKGT